MNRWECAARCGASASGIGGAIGLRAIGWHFEYGGRLLCPRCRPDPVFDCEERGAGEPCSLCAGTREAEQWQERIWEEIGKPEPRSAPTVIRFA